MEKRDRYRARIWFPLFSFFEARIDGMVPNEYVMPWTHFSPFNLLKIRRRARKLFNKTWKSMKIDDKKQTSVCTKRSKKKN